MEDLPNGHSRLRHDSITVQRSWQVWLGVVRLS
jgi:hypothetical protein